MNSSLVPTPRVDKNGRSVTRHMRTDGNSAKKLLSLPAPSDPKAKTVLPDEIVEKIGEEFNDSFSSSHTFRGFLLEIHNCDDEILPLAATLMSTGSDTSKRLTRGVVRDTVDDMKTFTHWNEDTQSGKPKGSRSWSQEYQLTKARLVSAWSLGNVIEESGVQAQIDDELEAIVEFAYDLEGHRRHDKLSGDPAYWRGVAALSLTNIVGGSNSSRITEFIEWAGKHDDIRAVMSTMLERKTVIVPVLQGIMEQTDIAPSLSSGRL